MQELLKEYFGEIALLIYILYPLIKRLWNRLNKKGDAAPKPEKGAREARAPKRAQRPPPREPPPAPLPPAVPQRSPEADFLEAARSQAQTLKQEATRLLGRAEMDPRLQRLVPSLRDDLLGRVDAIERSLGGRPTMSTIADDTTVLRGLALLLRYLQTMARQRSYGGSTFQADADKMADACYAPLLELARVQGLELRSSQPITVTGDWDLSIVPRFASTRVAPLRLPVGFENSLWRWPAIAHEVAHDFYYSLDGLEQSLHQRTGLPTEVEMPESSAELEGAWLRGLFGAWLPEIFADVFGTVSLGPAYVESMARTFRNPDSPQHTAVILQDGRLMDEHPPARLRFFMATRVLHHLGRHNEANDLWERWESDHSGVRLYYLPLGGQWVGLADETLHSIASSLIDVLVQRAWPELEGFQLLNIPGFAYLHGEHAEVRRLMRSLARGETVNGDVRWIMAAAVLAAAAQPSLHNSILDAARRSIVGIGEERKMVGETKRPSEPQSIAAQLVTSLRQPRALEEAIALGAAVTPYRPPRWRRG
ncbi:MAG: hypothetical protein KJO40_06340 [Deltaproteobacteria bacterium]|nr:hypothetical protein [Deltaproteobacteria bacterium]NND28838.1 hypothetical protein [Myxococcales bacterium]MBT8463494.1 hypothetical protein [Deltaproteobacteria bacterium]MBT8482640.1 hypothetical protein [Deltaproteobacteria bacterium]NNK06767.1 hypothetical protein [Myxococcales bacterium]